MQIRRLTNASGGGGGGGGNPSLPLNSIQYNNTNAFFGDSNAVRDPSTQFTDVLTPLVVLGNPVFTGSGNNDLRFLGSFTGVSGTVFTVTINSGGPTAPNTFDWTNSNGGGATNVPITAFNEPLNDGISIHFRTLINHVPGDMWTLTASTAMVGFQTTDNLFNFGIKGAGLTNMNPDGESGFFAGYGGQATQTSDISAVAVSINSSGNSAAIIVDANEPGGTPINLNVQDTSGAGSSINLSYTDATFGNTDSLGGGYGIHASDSGLAITNSGSDAYILPNTDGTNGQIMTTDGAGNVTFQNGGNITGTGSTTQVVIWTDSMSQGGDDTFTWDSITNSLQLGNIGQTHVKMNGSEYSTVLMQSADHFSVLYQTYAMFDIENASGISVSMGDVGVVNNGTRIVLNDGTESVNVYAPTVFNVADANGNNWIHALTGTGELIFGASGFGNGTSININDTGGGRGITFQSGTTPTNFLNFDFLNGSIQIGDLGNTVHGGGLSLSYNSALSDLGDFNSDYNSTRLRVDDTNLLINAQTNGAFTVTDVSQNQFLNIDVQTKSYSIGDILNINNGTTGIWDDTAQTVTINALNTFQVGYGGGYWIGASPSGQQAWIGSMGFSNNTYGYFEDATKDISMFVNGHKVMDLDGVALDYKIGDIAGTNLGTVLDVNDNAGTISVTAPNGIIVPKTITAIGTTGDQTINKVAGSVNFASGDASLTVTNSLVTVNSIIIVTVASNDASMQEAFITQTTGSFTIFPNSGPSGTTRVNFIVIN